MSYVDCNNEEAKDCLDNLIKEINDELTIGCQIPFTVPKKEIGRIVDKSKKYFYKMYEDSVEEMYIALPSKTFNNKEFKSGINNSSQPNLKSNRGVVTMPHGVYSVNNVFEINEFSGEDGGFGSNSISSGDSDFSLNKLLYHDIYGAGVNSENLMYYTITEKFIDNVRQMLQPHISYNYNRLTHKFRFMGKLPKNSVIFQVYSKIPDCDLFTDELFIRYCTAKAKTQLSRILGTFDYKLPGNISINYDMIKTEGDEELSYIIEELKEDSSVDFFYTS